jgi:chromosome partitioning protein
MTSVLAVANQKGGVGKTTTAAALAVAFSRSGLPVHVVDMDPQASLSHVFGHRDTKGLLHQALSNRVALPIVMLTDTLTLTPSSIHLASGESQFLGQPAREYLLRTSLEQTELPDDVLVILDCPPSLGILSFNCLAAAYKVLITVHPGNLEINVLPTLSECIKTARKHLNPSLDILGAILTKVDGREKIATVIQHGMRKTYPLLGAVHSETKLKYAMGEGRLLELTHSAALNEYERIARKIKKSLWQKQTETSPA